MNRDDVPIPKKIRYEFFPESDESSESGEDIAEDKSDDEDFIQENELLGHLHDTRWYRMLVGHNRNEIWETFNGVNILYSCLLSMAPGHAYSDDPIHVILSSFAADSLSLTSTPKIGSKADRRRSVVPTIIVSYKELRCYLENHDPTSAHNISLLNLTRSIPDAEQTLFVIRLPMETCFHWVLGIADHRRRNISVYDPLSPGGEIGKLTPEGENLIEGNTDNPIKADDELSTQDILRRQLNSIRNLMEYVRNEAGQWCQYDEGREWLQESAYIRIPGIPIQQDSESCGMLILLAGEYLMGRPQFWNHKTQKMLLNKAFEQLRMRYLKMIMCLNFTATLGKWMGKDDVNSHDSKQSREESRNETKPPKTATSDEFHDQDCELLDI